MATVESRNGQNVKHCQHNAQETCHTPERVPVPRAGENLANGDESAKRLVGFGFGFHNQFELFQIVARHNEGLFGSGRNGGKESVFNLAQLEDALRTCLHTDFAVGANGNGKRLRLSVADNVDADCGVFICGNGCAELVEIFGRDCVDAHNLVANLHSGSLGR